ncbi:MAG: UDP-N-acetylmuramate dehydrogenase [Actinomycetota bacterium]|nr:UDP-N-acetylmuramate dehydrogenase [Acidimicrobiales bacterium]MEC8815375.1 UDP-N-acetylmuramate dehydrogenase [Actinomycetota bacterium]MEC8970400.1 UDP-N-acetylmuramate dehydrogenase [Actinomycetota bacterium]MEC8983669.1 UDP-N-acetylmuramate dehydrogenase [Actinomycetota bacterium]MEC9427382.1 UDP-N-acetylmuramate dehydrogenase [Actinomycetota bacterium]
MTPDPEGLARFDQAMVGVEMVEGILTDHPIGPMTTYRAGGSAARFVRPVDRSELEAVAAGVASAGIPVLVVGRGSNLLVADAGFWGLVVQLGQGFEKVRTEGNRVMAGAAVSLPVLARRTVAESLTGFEWAVGVPGSLGGAVRMNAGGHGSDMASSLVSADTVDLTTGEGRHRTLADLSLGYRSSSIDKSEVVVEATIALAVGNTASGEERLAEIVRWRRENQPGGQNAGSVFTNPVGDSAGRLIDEAGLKGWRFGSASVSERHANFIQVDEGGSADDVVILMDVVARRVDEVHGIRLEPETVIVGFAGRS